LDAAVADEEEPDEDPRGPAQPIDREELDR
jgi:hypothetical protein